jgi:hypothetical protein
MRKAIGTLAVFLTAVSIWGQQPSVQSETDKLTAAASLFGPVLHKDPVPCSQDKGCSASQRTENINQIIDNAFEQSKTSLPADMEESLEHKYRQKTPAEQPVNTPDKASKTPAEPVSAGIPVPPPPAEKDYNEIQPQKQPETPVSKAQKPQPEPVKKFNPNEFRPNVKWEESHSTHFDIYTQKMAGTIGSTNLAMTFETSYQTLRRFIPWMMAGRVRVFVYQNEQSYLENEPEAKSWTRALAYPFRGEIVVYDVPGKTQELKEVFTHELTHIFTQQFFDHRKNATIQPPLWLDEGLAVLVEDQAYAGSAGGPWNHDYLTRYFVRDHSRKQNSFSSGSMFRQTSRRPPTYGTAGRQMGGSFDGPRRRRGRPIKLMNFTDFVKESSLDHAESAQNTQNWYLQAYLMVRFLLNPSGASSPTNRMQFERFTRLLAEGEAVRNPETGYLVKDENGKQVYKKYDLVQALGRTYWYNSMDSFEDAFWQWLRK